MKIGDNVIMEFHAFGVVSEKKLKIVELTETEIITDEVFGDADENRKFSRKTGKCLNDTNSFGGYRILKIN